MWIKIIHVTLLHQFHKFKFLYKGKKKERKKMYRISRFTFVISFHAILFECFVYLVSIRFFDNKSNEFMYETKIWKSEVKSKIWKLRNLWFFVSLIHIYVSLTSMLFDMIFFKTTCGWIWKIQEIDKVKRNWCDMFTFYQIANSAFDFI